MRRRSQLFGDDPAGQEVFTAWSYARYAEAVTRAGKAAYPLPMYVNVALNRTGKAPGDYPSGGPLPHLIAGRGLDVTVSGAASPALAGIDSAVEGVFDSQGRWIPGRVLNGDQTHQGRHVRLSPDQFQIQRVRFYRYR